MAQKKPSEMNFEEALAELESIVRTLESGDAPLDASIAAFERGIGLVKICNEKLQTAEQRVRVLVAGGDGMTEENFVPEKKNANA